MIEKLLIKEICNTADTELLLKLEQNWFLDKQTQELIKFLKSFYSAQQSIPTTQELIALNKGDCLKDLPESTNIKYYLLETVQDRYHKSVLYDKLFTIIDESEDASFEESLNELMGLGLNLADLLTNNDEDFFMVGEHKEIDALQKKSLGLGAFDTVNKGMANSEVMLIGGHRGSGKSILALNIALHNFIKNFESVAFISLEMRTEEVLSRLDAIISGVPALKILSNDLNNEERLQILKARAKVFKDNQSEEFGNFIELLSSSPKINTIRGEYEKIPYKREKFFIVDAPNGSMSKIQYILTKAKHRYNIGMGIVDYLNIIADSNADLYDWKSQTNKSNALKVLARQLNIKIVSPFQTSEEGQVKYAKSIEDPVDYSIIFKKKESDSSIINLYTSKIRNGQHLKFNLKFDSKSLNITDLKEGM